MKKVEIIENKELREEMIEKVNVLDKVKDLLLLGNSEYATVSQVAEYYEVGLEAIKSIVKRNSEELEGNGFKILKGNELKEFKGKVLNDENSIENIKYISKLALFSKRAILNVGMLLEDSVVADKVKQELGLSTNWHLRLRKEIKFLDKLEESLKPFNIKGERQYCLFGCKYRIDYYIKDLNIAIEYDEVGHANYTYEAQEGRQEEIEKELGCKFIRVSETNSDEYNIGLVIKDIFNLNVGEC